MSTLEEDALLAIAVLFVDDTSRTFMSRLVRATRAQHAAEELASLLLST